MPFLGPVMAADLTAELAGKGFAGVSMPLMANAIGLGSTLSLIGKSFNTSDTGSGTAPGVGTGIGLQGLVGSVVSLGIFQSAVTKFGQAGPNLLDVCDAIGAALEKQMPLATLTSSHLPVFAGAGTIIPGSIVIPATEWASNVNQLGIASGFLGDDWGNLCDAIGDGCTTAFSTVTGSVVITGAPPPTPNPVPPSPNTIIPSGVMI